MQARGEKLQGDLVFGKVRGWNTKYVKGKGVVRK